MTAVKYDESKDLADRKVNIQVLQGKLRNNVHLSHLYCNREPGKGQHEDVALSQRPHCHKWRELHVVE